MLTHVLRVVCWTDQHGVRLRPRHHPALANGLCMDVIVVVFCSGLWRAPAKAESSRLPRALQLRSRSFRSRCCVGHVPHSQWALLDSDTVSVSGGALRLCLPHQALLAVRSRLAS